MRLPPNPLGNVKRISELNSNIFLSEPWLAQWLILLSIHAQFHIFAKPKCQPDNPIQFRGVEHVSSLPIRKEIHISIQHDSVFVEVEIRMGHIPKKSSSSIIWSREIVTVMKQPADTGIGRQVLIGKGALPPTEIVDGLKSRCQ